MKSQKAIIGGRPCVVMSLGRVRGDKGWRFYNLMAVRFTDNDEYLSMGAGEFVKWSKQLDREAKDAAQR
jgi:hypothetical protein